MGDRPRSSVLRTIRSTCRYSQSPPGVNGHLISYLNRTAGQVHHVSFDLGSLAGKLKVVVNYRVTADRRARLVPKNSPTLAGRSQSSFSGRGTVGAEKGDTSPIASTRPLSMRMKSHPVCGAW